MKVSPITDIRDVPTAIWFATLLLTFHKCSQNKKFTEKDTFLIQTEICNTAFQILNERQKVDGARTSQHCNGDHKKNTFYYLRANGLDRRNRRLTAIGEFNGYKEKPDKYKSHDTVKFNISDEKNNICLEGRELRKWFEQVYSQRINPRGKSSTIIEINTNNSNLNPEKKKSKLEHSIGTYKNRGY